MTGRSTTLGPWTTLMDNLMDGYVPVHEVSHRELPTGFSGVATSKRLTRPLALPCLFRVSFILKNAQAAAIST